MSNFKDRLWRDLVREQGPQLARIDGTAARHGRRARARVLAGTTVGLAAVGTTLALVLGAASTTPAFAVTRNHNGTVTIALQAIAAIPDANAKLAGSGLRVKVVQVKAGCGVANGSVPPALTAARRARDQSHLVARPAQVGARFDPRKIPAGKVLVIAAWRAGRSVHVRPAHLMSGGVPACLPPPMPPPPGRCRPAQAPPPGNSGNSGSSGNSGNSGNSANSGSSGNSAKSTTTLRQVPVPLPKAHNARVAVPRTGMALACVAAGPPRWTPGTSGNSGSSGNSRTSGNSGTSGNTGTSGNS